jgi:hypothetical protein
VRGGDASKQRRALGRIAEFLVVHLLDLHTEQRVVGGQPNLRVDLVGELPLGLHRASLREVLDQFGVGSAQRKVLAHRLERVYRTAKATDHLALTSLSLGMWTCSWSWRTRSTHPS